MLSWPPPGLERLQGDLWRVAGRGALGGALLVLPILFVVTRTGDFAGLGPFADAWWITLVLAAVGLAFAMDALVRAARLAGRTSRALEQGFDLGTVALVVADQRRDMGFLLQGGRWFGEMTPEERVAVRRLRVAAAVGHALAGLWLPVALSVGLLLAARGVLPAMGIVWLTLGPAGAAYLAAGVLGALEDHQVRSARTAWFRQPWSADVAAGETQEWRSRLAEVRGEVPPPAGGRWAPLLRRVSLVVGAAAVVGAVPVLTLLPVSAVGPVLALVSIPRFDQLRARAAVAEAVRGRGVPPDSSVTPARAGQLLQDLLHVGSTRPPSAGERPPSQRIEVPWLPESRGPTPVGAEPHRWADTLFQVVAAGPSPELRAYLADIAAHPGLGLFAELARAPAMDVAAARWVEPFPPGTSMATLPIPRFGGLREASYAQMAAAAHDLTEGRPAAAETRIREVVSVGLLMADHGNTVIDNLIGYFLAQSGATALEHLYRVSGRTGLAEALAADRELARRVAARTRSGVPDGLDATLKFMRDAVTDTAAPPGYRWEMLGITATVTPCLTLRRMVLGPDEAYRAFEERARAALVRHPSEEHLFDLVRHGYWGAGDAGGFSLIGRALALSMQRGPGTCGDVMRRWNTFQEIL